MVVCVVGGAARWGRSADISSSDSEIHLSPGLGRLAQNKKSNCLERVLYIAAVLFLAPRFNCFRFEVIIAIRKLLPTWKQDEKLVLVPDN